MHRHSAVYVIPAAQIRNKAVALDNLQDCSGSNPRSLAAGKFFHD
jgi:hypothetical protein